MTPTATATTPPARTAPQEMRGGRAGAPSGTPVADGRRRSVETVGCMCWSFWIAMSWPRERSGVANGSPLRAHRRSPGNAWRRTCRHRRRARRNRLPAGGVAKPRRCGLRTHAAGSSRQPLGPEPAMQVYLPIAEMSVDALLLVGIGFGVGWLSGLFGVGGGFLLTPLLILIGIPSPVAVASGANQTLGASVSGLIAQWRRGNVDAKMGAVLLAGGLLGSLRRGAALRPAAPGRPGGPGGGAVLRRRARHRRRADGDGERRAPSCAAAARCGGGCTSISGCTACR